MYNDDERDYAEEQYNGSLCPACGAPHVPGTESDEFHTDSGEGE